MLGKIIGGMIVLMVGITLIPTISSLIKDTNMTGANQVVLGLVPLFFAISILASAIFIVYSAFQDAGLIEEGNSLNYDEDYEKLEPEEKHKQTYLEYVKERRTVERLMHDVN
jgi:hypothetical protein